MRTGSQFKVCLYVSVSIDMLRLSDAGNRTLTLSTNTDSMQSLFMGVGPVTKRILIGGTTYLKCVLSKSTNQKKRFITELKLQLLGLEYRVGVGFG